MYNSSLKCLFLQLQVNDTMDGMVMYPFSDEFSDYDLNQDKEIEYEEFAFAVMKQFPMGQPEEMRVPFFWADANGDERLDMDEFVGAPFMFARKYQIKFFYETFFSYKHIIYVQ